VATEVTIPNLGYTMTVAKILNWQKAVGDTVETGEVLLEIETDKVNYGIESPASGVIKAILAKVGEEIPVGGLVAIIGRADEKIDVRSYPKEKKEPPVPEKVQADGKKETFPPVVPTAGGRVFASPLARKIAGTKQVDLSRVKGSGRSGRIRMADVEKYILEGKPRKLEPAPSVGPVEVAEVIPLTTMRRTIAQRLAQSFHDAPHFNLCMEVDMTEAKELLEKAIPKKGEARLEVKLSLNDLFIKAVAVTLRDYPLLNARWKGDQVEILRDINIGLAVALDTGLIVPAMERADQKRLWQIAKERIDLVERARQGRLTLPELERGTFTVSNLGMYDITFFTSILNPPQTGILSIGKTVDRPVVREGAIVIRPIVQMSLAIDHRVVDGAVGAKFMQDLKQGLEKPGLLL
jgi:pyruvate dehydrogenase E2 component (dihydrolipoamide acetyltransferase)